MNKMAMMKKISLSLAVVLVMAAFAPAAGVLPSKSLTAEASETFPDVHSFEEEIEYLAGLGIIQGFSNGTFRPAASITRLNAVRMVLREMGIEDLDAPNPSFSDMNPSTRGYGEVAKAVEIGFISGKVDQNGNRFFDPHGTLTRAEMAKILTEAYDLTENDDIEFVDVSSAYWANDYISRLATARVTNGYPGGIFKPKGNLERQHFAVFMARLLDPERFAAAPVEIPDGYAAPSTDTPGTYVNGILVVNKVYSLPSTYNPGVNTLAQRALNDMIAGAAAEGITLSVISGYRSYSYQQTLYNNYVARYGQAAADRFSARPGHSEHQTGLAFDFGGTDQSHWLQSSFGDTREGKWLAANAYQYGFILRYPQGKESITGYMYEPWHFRYVGSLEAAKIRSSGQTLEEYLGVRGR